MNEDEWTAVRVRATTDRAAVIGALFASGAESLQEVDDGFVTHIRSIDRKAVNDAIRRADRGATVQYSPTPSVDWTSAWRAGITAHRVGKLVVTPPWLADQYGPGERVIIEPGMAFGTGEHETTRAVMRLMHQVIRPGDSVADLGAGSAVLCIAAARMGAARVVAIEIDGDAIGNAEENIARNGVADRVATIEGDAAALLPLVAPVRVIVANIVSSVLIDLMPTLCASLSEDGEAILGGMLIEERAAMERVLSDAAWCIRASDEDGSWWTATIARA